MSFFTLREVEMKVIEVRAWKRPCILMVLSLGLVVQFAHAQRNHQRRYGGEFNVEVHNASAYHIELNHLGTVYGSRCDWYPVTQDYGNFDETDKNLSLSQIDNPECGLGDFAFGEYRLRIDDTVFIYVDFRDGDYRDGNGDGSGYITADLWIYFDRNTHYFYKDENLTERIYGNIAIWEDGRKSPATPRIPVTVKTDFGSGSVIVDNNSVSYPGQVKWETGSHSLNVTSPQTVSSVTFTFSSWSDNNSQSHSVTASLADFSKMWIANFTAKPDAPTSLSYAGNIGDPVHLT
jgi:hypothetical protein